MSVGKEELYIFEKYEQMQKQIYPDACDRGVIATQKMKDELHEAIFGLKALDKHYKQKTVRDKRGLTFNCNGQILLERSDLDLSKYCGYKIEVHYYETRYQGKPLNYFSIHTEYDQKLNG